MAALMEYEAIREEEDKRWHVIEKGQTTRGTTLTDEWLKQMGFWPLSRTNIDDAIRATMAGAGGMILDPYAARHPLRQKDLNGAITEGFKSYRKRSGVRLPESLVIKG